MCLSYCISVWSKREPELSPFIFHLLHGFFQGVLLTGRRSNLLQPRAEVKKNPSPSDHGEYFHNPANVGLTFFSKHRTLTFLFTCIPTWCNVSKVSYLSENLESPRSNMFSSELFTSGLTSKPTMLLICRQT